MRVPKSISVFFKNPNFPPPKTSEFLLRMFNHWLLQLMSNFAFSVKLGGIVMGRMSRVEEELLCGRRLNLERTLKEWVLLIFLFTNLQT